MVPNQSIDKQDASMRTLYMTQRLALLVHAALLTTWLKSIGRQELQVMFAQILDRLAPHLIEGVKSEETFPETSVHLRCAFHSF